ncbi:mitochondrial import receptor protein [Pseudocyphellaria aurata]|nr:mitochondrial import receptor protein [Pseudocyphellaria aurata]
MVELEEVEDPELEAPQPGPIDDDDDSADYTDTDSSLSSSSLISSTLPSETITERILALRDMVPPSTRRRIYSTASQLTRLVKGGALWGGKGLWVLTASALMVGVPWAMASVEEQQLMELEREQRARDTTGEVMAPGATTSQAGMQGRPSL